MASPNILPVHSKLHRFIRLGFIGTFSFVFLLHSEVISQTSYNFFISNTGNNLNRGTSQQSPKKTIQGTAALLKSFAIANGKVSIGLKGGDTFDETLSPTYPLFISSYYESPAKNDFAILNGSDEFNTGWEKTGKTGNTYEQAVKYSGMLSVGNYSYAYVIEIDKILEKTAPLTARKLLLLAPSQDAVDSIPGSFYEPIGTDNPVIISIHTSDSKTPNLHPRYRYEVAVRGTSVYGRKYDNNQFENINVRGYGDGYGLLQGGYDTYCNKVIFGPGAPIHHIVLKNGIISNSLFLPAAKNSNFFAIVFYNVEGFGKHNKITNSIFLDIPFPIYTHNSYGSNYAAVDLENVIAFADSTNSGDFMSTSNNDTVRLNNVYADKYQVAYYNRSPKYCTVTNSYFKDVSKGIYFFPTEVNATVNNVFIKTKNDKAIGIVMGEKTSLHLSNSIIHLNGTTGNFVTGAGIKTNNINATGNIFISDINPSEVAAVADVNTDQGVGSSNDIWTNNVYILLRGNKFTWHVTNKLTNGGSSLIQSFDDWKKQSGQDKNSLFFDLRNDRRGLKAIFIDPDNGDYELANTNEGRQIQALKAGMSDPITCFLKKPTYEEAAELIKNDKVLSINSCKNPCVRNSIRENPQFKTTILNHQQIKLSWQTAMPGITDHFEIERSVQSSSYRKINSIKVTSDSLYSFVDNDIAPSILYNYRLVLVANNGYKCYSEIKTITTENTKSVIDISPNPSPGKIKVSVRPYTGPATFTVVNSLGEQVLQKELDIVSGAPQVFNLSNCAKGIYWLKVKNIDGLAIQKFILQ